MAAPPQLAANAAGRRVSSGPGHAGARLGSAVCVRADGRVLHREDPQDARLSVPRGRHEVSTPRPQEHRHRPDVLVGSSRGGAVAMNINSADARLVLLCPAWKRHGSARTVKHASWNIADYQRMKKVRHGL